MINTIQPKAMYAIIPGKECYRKLASLLIVLVKLKIVTSVNKDINYNFMLILPIQQI